MSKSAKGTRETQNAQTGYDQQSGDYMRDVWNAARAAGTAGPSGLVTGAAGFNTGAQTAGNLGLNALSGDAGAVQRMMNPYQAQVIDAANQQWNQTDQLTMNAVNDRATAAGAFGGSRHGVATGVALGQNAMGRNAQIGGLLSSGFDSAMGRAGQLAQAGFAGAQGNANLGMAGVGSPEQWYLNMLNGGWHGPTGQTSSGAGSQVGTQSGFSLPFLGGGK